MAVAAPTVSQGGSASNTSSEAVTWPATFSGDSGAKGLLIVAMDGSTGISTLSGFDAGMVDLETPIEETSHQAWIKEYTADGTETGSMTLSVTGTIQSVQWMWLAWPSSANIDLTGILNSWATNGSTGSTTFDPAAIGSVPLDDYWGIAVCTHDGGDVAVTTQPGAPYNTAEHTQTDGGGNGVSIHVAMGARDAISGTEDAGAFVLPSSEHGTVGLILVPEVAVAGAGGGKDSTLRGLSRGLMRGVR